MKTQLIQLIDEEIRSNRNIYETGREFIERISLLYYSEISHLKMYAPFALSESVLEEIKIEVQDIYRVKTYGHYSLQNFRLSQFAIEFSSEPSAEMSTEFSSEPQNT